RVIEDVFADGYPHSRAVVLDEDGEYYMSPPIRASFFYDDDEDLCFYDDDEDVCEEEGEVFAAFRRGKRKISKVSVVAWRTRGAPPTGPGAAAGEPRPPARGAATARRRRRAGGCWASPPLRSRPTPRRPTGRTAVPAAHPCPGGRLVARRTRWEEGQRPPRRR